ncbi:MAG TPA: SusC/RagA family TonB-linked outer membrane protein [Gemmatimonadaceae bacterium]
MKVPGRLQRLAAGLLLSGLIPALAAAQGTTLSGRVTGESGAPLASASVRIPELSLGALTGADGRYSFTVPATSVRGQAVTIIARRLGYEPHSVAATLTGTGIVTDFRLTQAATALNEVVVTALGIERKKSQLGTAVQQVDNAELNTTHDLNVVNQLEGKVSGVTINASGTQGGSSRILIRGANSITGNNQPLFIVDGTAVSNNAIGSDANGSGRGLDFGSVINDINPEDVANISVLKGPNAAAIYGSRAANGVVLITTRRGQRSGGIRTQATSGVTWEQPSILPTYQNQYGQGAGGQFKFVNGKGGGVQDGNDQSYGPKLDGRLIDQFTGPQQPWIAHPDNVSSFFNTGRTIVNNVSFSGGTDRANARASIGSEAVGGIIPNNTFQKFTGLLSADMNVSSRLSATANVQYVANNGHNRAGVGYNTGILEQFIWFGRQVDMNALRNYYTDNGQLFNWNYNYHNNPFYLQYANPELDQRDHIIAGGSATYKVADWLNASLRSGTDFYRYNINQNYAPGNINFTNLAFQGGFYYRNDYSSQNNTQLLFTANKGVGSRLQLNATAGGNHRYAAYRYNTTASSSILAADIYNPSNSAVSPTIGLYDERRATNSVYGTGSFTWSDFWTVEVTGRNDWSSTLPKGNNSYFYPSISSSLVVTDMLPSVKGNFLSYLKLRGSIAEVGNDAEPYQLQTVYVGNANKFGSLPQYTLNDQVANVNLKPEQTKSSEAGVEVGFFDNRITLDASVYNKTTTNEIVNVTVSPASGFTSAAVNAGKMQNKGFEALLNIVPIRTSGGFEWTSTINYAANKNTLVALAPGLQTIVLGNTWTLNTEARVGQPYGSLFGNGFLRDSATGQLLTSGGFPIKDPNRRVLGNINPTWVGGWNNTVSFGPFTASALIDVHKGGQIFSVSNMFGQYAGVFAESLKGREVDWNNPGLVIQGIDQQTGKPNTINVTAEDYFQNLFEIHEAFIYDDSWVKLRELRVGVELPASFTSRLRISALNIALVGRNLWTHSNVPNIDPEFSYQTGNYQGAEFAALPTTRSLGFNVRITP